MKCHTDENKTTISRPKSKTTELETKNMNKIIRTTNWFVNLPITTVKVFVSPSPISAAEALCFRVVRPSVRPGVRAVSMISCKPMEEMSPNVG